MVNKCSVVNRNLFTKMPVFGGARKCVEVLYCNGLAFAISRIGIDWFSGKRSNKWLEQRDKNGGGGGSGFVSNSQAAFGVNKVKIDGDLNAHKYKTCFWHEQKFLPAFHFWKAHKGSAILTIEKLPMNRIRWPSSFVQWSLVVQVIWVRFWNFLAIVQMKL